MSKYLSLILVGVALALVTGCVGAPPPPTPAPPSATPIPPTATSAPPTSTPAPPTATPRPTATATRSPLTGSGGGVIAFVSDQSGSQEIYVMNADGSDQRRLTNDPSTNAWPNWSPDGRQIAFQSNRSGALNIYVMDILGGSSADDSKVSQMTNSQAGRGGSWEPAWSPDGQWIVYSAQQASGSDLFLVNPNGTERRRLTDNKAIDGCPTWSPDGKQIAFFSDRDGNWEIYVMKSDGSDVRRLTQHPGQDHSPAWSPDGSRIAFVSDRDGNEEIYLMNLADALQGTDGTGLRRLTRNKVEDWFPAWSPDGKWIAFSSSRDGNHEIYVMPVADALQGTDGNDQKRLTNNNAQDWGPVWRPQSP